jgi:hypothetical protein
VVTASVFEPKLWPKLLLAKAIEFTWSPLETAAVEFITLPNCVLPITPFQLPKAGKTALFQEVLPSDRVTLPLPSDSCMTTVLPFGHFGPSSTYASTREGREAPKTTNRATSVVKALARRECRDIKAALSGLIISMIPREAKSVLSTPTKSLTRKNSAARGLYGPRFYREFHRPFTHLKAQLSVTVSGSLFSAANH